MYEQKSSQQDELKIFGIKIIEKICESVDIYDHEFQDDKEEQGVLAGRTVCTYKLFGITISKWQCCYNPEHFSPLESKSKKSLTITKLTKISLITIASILAGVCIFMAGIFTAYNDWFNDKVYIKSYQMEKLNIKSLKSYEKVLLKNVHSQTDINEASAKRYKYYHEYYEKVVAKIKNTDFNDEKVKNVIIAYIDGYDKRKEEMINVLFPHLNDTDEYDGNYYGTLIGSVYPQAMLEFDRNELLTYRMILENMYDAYYIKDFDSIFEE